MLNGIVKVILLVLTLVLKFFRKKEKAREVLSETPVIDSVREDAEEKAVAKFGPRTDSPKR